MRFQKPELTVSLFFPERKRYTENIKRPRKRLFQVFENAKPAGFFWYWIKNSIISFSDFGEKEETSINLVKKSHERTGIARMKVTVISFSLLKKNHKRTGKINLFPILPYNCRKPDFIPLLTFRSGQGKQNRKNRISEKVLTNPPFLLSGKGNSEDTFNRQRKYFALPRFFYDDKANFYEIKGRNNIKSSVPLFKTGRIRKNILPNA